MREPPRYLLTLALLAAACFLAVSPGKAAEWKWYYSTVPPRDKSGNSVSIKEFYDADTIERTRKETIIFWTKAVLEGDSSGGIDTIVRHIEISCTENRYRTLETARFYGNKLVDELSSNDEKWAGFSPGSSWWAFCEALLKTPD